MIQRLKVLAHFSFSRAQKNRTSVLTFLIQINIWIKRRGRKKSLEIYSHLIF